MGEKSLQKKQYILETARKVFVEKGYKNVTMKDIVEACDISRGGLYLYFGSTEELLLAVLQKEADEIDDIFTETIAEEDSAADILTLFLKEQKKELLRKKNNLTMAVYEY
ncbi:MAG: helix-turn-helix transcriptional regulator, partial [Lachnospiraceae bacterium]|nr:helix-turn-helix transcriptional regulator [Lachnospiraceae bacterium]